MNAISPSRPRGSGRASPGSRVVPPWGPIECRWEYKELVRDAEGTELPTEAELNTLGADGWELASAVREGPRVHFYFKRERVR
jgi:hypothetical protein